MTTAKPSEKLFPDSVERRSQVKRALYPNLVNFKDIPNEHLITLGRYLETGQPTRLTERQQKVRANYLAKTARNRNGSRR